MATPESNASGSLSRTKAKNTKRLPHISEAEWTVMKVVWRQGPVTANQVVQALRPHTSWKPRTIQTLLSRLVKKQVLRFEKQGREYLFHPLVDAETYRQAAAESFVNRVFDGKLAPFLACFLQNEKLSEDEIAQLKRFLDRHSK